MTGRCITFIIIIIIIFFIFNKVSGGQEAHEGGYLLMGHAQYHPLRGGMEAPAGAMTKHPCGGGRAAPLAARPEIVSNWLL